MKIIYGKRNVVRGKEKSIPRDSYFPRDCLTSVFQIWILAGQESRATASDHFPLGFSSHLLCAVTACRDEHSQSHNLGCKMTFLCHVGGFCAQLGSFAALARESVVYWRESFRFIFLKPFSYHLCVNVVFTVVRIWTVPRQTHVPWAWFSSW